MMATITKGKMQDVLRTYNWEKGLNLPTVSKTVINLH